MNMSGTRRRWEPAVLVVGLLVLSTGAGALGGWGWWRWWSPAPDGVIGQRTDTGEIGWFAEPFDPGQAHVASSTFEYVVLGFVLALAVGLLGGLLGRNRALLTLATLVVAAAAAAAAMRAVGMAFSPPNPQQWAVAANIGHHYPGNLRIGGWTPYLVWPVGTLLGFLVVMLTLTTEEKRAPEAVEELSVR
ncbi:MAG TPA: hypothetical protein VN088_17320 [Nocardioides sp.]|nr:hypothetical protein [Nocardioides sp.]